MSVTQARSQQAVFDLIAEGYDHEALRVFPFCADYMVHRLQPAPGSKLLDVATATGAVAIAAAQRIGPDGRVFAVDRSEAMLDRAFRNMRKRALNNIDLHAMDAQQLDFRSGYFDYAVCSFGLAFLPDKPAALREWLRVVKPGGRVLFSNFAAQAFEPLFEVFASRMAASGCDVNAPPWLQMSDGAELLKTCGAVEIDVHTRQFGYHLSDAELWWAVLWNSAFRADLQQLPPAQLEAMKREHLAEVASLATADGLWLNLPVHIAQGRRPSA